MAEIMFEDGVTGRAWLGAGFCPRKSRQELRETGCMGEGLNGVTVGAHPMKVAGAYASQNCCRVLIYV